MRTLREIAGSLKIFFILGSSCLILPQFSYAKFEIESVKGIHHPIQAQYSDRFSPLWGVIAVESGLMENIRFRGFYGEMKDGIICAKKFLEAGDCPQDGTAAVVQKLVPSQDGSHLVPNQVPSDPISKLDRVGIARILTAIYDFENKKIREDQLSDTVLQAITDDYFATGGLLPKAKKLEGRQIRALQDELIHPMIQVLRDRERSSYPYPHFTLEHSLLGFLWLKVRDKSDFLPYYKTISDKIQDSFKFLVHVPNQEALEKLKLWREASFSKTLDKISKKRDIKGNGRKELLTAVYQEFVKAAEVAPNTFIGSPSLSLETSLASDPELSVVMGFSYDILISPHPPLSSYGLSAHPRLPQGKKFSNCIENSIYNFLNLLLIYTKEGTNPHEVLSKLKGSGMNIHDGLLEFYKQRGKVSQIQTPLSRDLWTLLAASGLHGVQYEDPTDTPVCNMMPSHFNVLAALETLIGDTVLHQEKLPSKKWERICEIFSRKDFNLSWHSSKNVDTSEADRNIEINFFLNGNPFFTWKFFEKHAAVFYREKVRDPSTDDFTLDFYAFYGTAMKRDASDLALFMDDQTVRQIKKTGSQMPSHFLSLIFFRLAGSSIPDLLTLLDLMSTQDSTAYDGILEKLIQKLPEGDEYSLAQAFYKLERLVQRRITKKLSVPSGFQEFLAKVGSAAFLKNVSEKQSGLDLSEAGRSKEFQKFIDYANRPENQNPLNKIANMDFGQVFAKKPVERVILNGEVKKFTSQDRCVTIPFEKRRSSIAANIVGARTGDDYHIQYVTEDLDEDPSWSYKKSEVPGFLYSTDPEEAVLSPLDLYRRQIASPNTGDFRLLSAKQICVATAQAELRRVTISADEEIFITPSTIVMDEVLFKSPDFITMKPGPFLRTESSLKKILWENGRVLGIEDQVVLNSHLSVISPPGAGASFIDFEKDRFQLKLWNPGRGIQFCF